MNRTVPLALAAALCGCSGSSPGDEVGREDSCVPTKFQTTDVPWVPKRSNEKRGISFRGCDRFSKGDDCPLPSQLVSGSVVWDDRPSKVLGEMPADAYAAMVARDAKQVTKDARTGYLLVPEPETEGRWYVWEARSGSLSDASTLVANCETASVLIDGRREARISCRRTRVGQEFTLTYAFFSPTHTPTQIDEMDEMILRAVRDWGCAD